MGQRKGELSSSTIDREFPHQIILATEYCSGDRHHFIEYCCAAEGWSLAPRKHSVFTQNRWHYVHCFRDREHAEQFRNKFGGDWFDPATRGRGARWHLAHTLR